MQFTPSARSRCDDENHENARQAKAIGLAQIVSKHAQLACYHGTYLPLEVDVGSVIQK